MSKTDGSAELSIFPDERWADIPGFDGMYQASSEGRIRSTRANSQWSRWKHYAGAVLKQNGRRYKQVSLQDEGGESNYNVHSLVLMAFVGPRPSGMQACHCNGDRRDNRLCNLRWDTIQANHADKWTHGTQTTGHKHHRAKYTDAQERGIAAAQGSVSEVARRYGVGRDTVRAIRLRNGWHKVGRFWQCRVVDCS